MAPAGDRNGGVTGSRSASEPGLWRVRTGEERRSVPEWEGDGLCDCQPSALNHRNRTAARDNMSMN
ncbi:hypothetical protein, partial [Pantoea ananatis]|uniref:hypothetical protein n=1 Tax=Pantoea ananas TaxID=553 RepID=UPI001A9124F1